MIVEIPLTEPADFPFFTIGIALDAVEYRLTFQWNTRESRWMMSIATADGTEIQSGFPVVVDFPLLDRFQDDELPPGILMAVDTTGAGNEITAREELGDRVQLLYLSVGDF
jgi:hypothetical protein